jgi:hypothetical protein
MARGFVAADRSALIAGNEAGRLCREGAKGYLRTATNRSNCHVDAKCGLSRDYP